MVTRHKNRADVCKSIICIIDLKNGGSGHEAWNKSDLFL
jgi:hypothetical protein